MASISSDPNGRKRILFVNGNGERKAIRLGKVSVKTAETFLVRIEALNAACISNTSLDNETAAWLRKIGDDLHTKLASVGLVLARNRSQQGLGAFLDSWLQRREGGKPNSYKNYKAAVTKLKAFFGETIGLHEITHSMAESFMVKLLGEHARSTAGRLLKFARQFMASAIRDDLIAKNPFDGIHAPTAPDESRKVFVERATIQAVLDACPDNEWQLIVALCRFNGLRCPSEVLALEWSSINWARDRMTILSPKLEHCEGGGVRVCPIFPETRVLLEKRFEMAEAGSRFVITRYREVDVNLRQQLHRILRKAGVKPWPKPFVNMRGSCETELMAKFPAHVVVNWLGHSVRIAQKHYTTVREEDFERASQGGAESGALEAQNRAQQASVSIRDASQIMTEPLEIQGVFADSPRNDDDTEYTRQESNL